MATVLMNTFIRHMDRPTTSAKKQTHTGEDIQKHTKSSSYDNRHDSASLACFLHNISVHNYCLYNHIHISNE